MGSFLLAALVLLVIVLALIAHMGRGRSTPTGPAPASCRARTPLTPPERELWRIMRSVVPPDVSVCPKLRLLDAIAPRDSKDDGARKRVIQMHVDFLLTDRVVTRALVAVELGYSSHPRAKRRERDAFVAEGLAMAGYSVRAPSICLVARSGAGAAGAQKRTAFINELIHREHNHDGCRRGRRSHRCRPLLVDKRRGA
jgi:hypothetical protein